jgi:hypothetical protein
MTNIKNRLIDIKNNIEQCESSANRADHSVKLLAVSKTWSADILREAAEAGQQCFGENYLQEALEKINALSDLKLEWHFIGPIQSNKTKDIATHFDWVQSLDRIKIARRLNEQRPEGLYPLQVCIQINIDNEQTKSGIDITSVEDFAQQLTKFEHLTLRGLMIIPSKYSSQEQQQASFEKAYVLFKQLKQRYATVDTLSMGMSADMEVAVAAGSTMVRIGTGLFGQRHTLKT